MTIKVKDTKLYKTHPSWESKTFPFEIPVVEGKLILLKIPNTEAINGLSIRKDNGTLMLYPISEEDHRQAQYLKPIIISETEKIEVGDKFLINNTIHSCTGYDGLKVISNDESTYCHSHGICKILALPNHFSPEQLQMIVDSKLKKGDKVLVECDNTIIKDKISGLPYVGEKWDYIIDYYFIRLNSANHIILHKSEEKMFSVEKVKEILYPIWHKANSGHGDAPIDSEYSIKVFNDWFEQNVKEN